MNDNLTLYRPRNGQHYGPTFGQIEIPALSFEDKERFLGKVRSGNPDDCWTWIGGKMSQNRGYGLFYLRGKYYRAHRIAYSIAIGPVPLGKFVCHSCDNPKCVNPSHLWLGTHAENMSDKKNKGRQSRVILYGENAGSAKLCEKQVMEIRSRYDNNRLGPIKAACEEYKISPRQLYRITRRQRWSYLK